MTSPDDLTPPTPDPLSEQHKQVMRADVLASAEGRGRRREHRWLMPGLAAAAVLAIVAVGAVIGQDDGDSSGPAGRPVPLPPAGGGRVVSAAPTTVHPATASTSPRVVKRGQHVIPGKGQVKDDTTTCDQEIAHFVEVGNPGLDGATLTADRTYGDYMTSLYETKSAWVVCDDFAAADGGAPTLLAAHDKADTYQPDLTTLAVSENTLMSGETQFVAAGRDFDGVQRIQYDFPDGHTEHAVLGVNGLWSMTYLPTSGPLADPDVNETKLDPIQATVDYTDGTSHTFIMQWGVDTCAQLNHGC